MSVSSPSGITSLSRLLLLLCLAGSCCRRISASLPLLSNPSDLHSASASEPGPDDDDAVECIDPTPPNGFPAAAMAPACSLLLLRYKFGHSVGCPPVTVNYTAPPEDCRWSRAVLEFSAACAGEQSDRIAAVWLDGVEMLRTSTAKPTETGVFWKTRKDVTHFSALLKPEMDQKGRRKASTIPRVLSVMLENSVDDVNKGVYHVNISIDFYGGRGAGNSAGGHRDLGEFERLPSAMLRRASSVLLNAIHDDDDEEEEEEGGGFIPAVPYFGDEAGRETSEIPVVGDSSPTFVTERTKLKNLLGRPADMIIPVANIKGGEQAGYWFRVDGDADVRGGRIRIPKNAYKAVLEVCVSFHGEDEFWYSNPPDSLENYLSSRRGNWAFREVVLTVDGLYAGTVVPFPVMYPGGINHLMWTPVVAIKAFDLPTYHLDLTPFLGNLADGRPHSINFQVSYAIPYWLINGNLHLWLDPRMPAVRAMMVRHFAEPTFVSRNANNNFLDGRFQLEAGRQARFEGWVRSSLGNLTTLVDTHFKYKSSVEYKFQGTLKEVYSQSKYYADVRITERPNRFLARVINQAKYPVQLLSSTAGFGDRLLARTNLSHTFFQFTDITLNQLRSQISVTDMQIAGGTLQSDADNALAGDAASFQTYQRRDNGRCHTRKLTARNGGVTADQTNTDCNMRLPMSPLFAV